MGGRCARSDLANLGRLYVQKAVLQCIVAPLTVLATALLKQHLRRHFQRYENTERCILQRIRSKLIDDKDKNRMGALTAMITNCEMTIVLGPIIPLLVPLCAIATSLSLLARGFAARRL